MVILSPFASAYLPLRHRCRHKCFAHPFNKSSITRCVTIFKKLENRQGDRNVIDEKIHNMLVNCCCLLLWEKLFSYELWTVQKAQNGFYMLSMMEKRIRKKNINGKSTNHTAMRRTQTMKLCAITMRKFQVNFLLLQQRL